MSRIKNIIKNRPWWNTSTIRVVVLCFFAATAFWFLNALNANYSTTVKYPLTFIYNTEQYIAIDDLPDNVQINISGLGWNLFRNSLGIKVAPLTIPLDRPSDTRRIAGSSLTGFLSDQLDEFDLNYILTDTLYINIDERGSRRFALAVDSLSISLDSDYRITTPIRYSPDSIELEGPQSFIEQLGDTIFITIPQEEISENFNENVAIQIPNSTLIRRNPPTANVVFGVEEFIRAQQLVPLKAQNFPENGKAYIERNSILVNYLVALSKTEAVSADDFEIIADYNKINPEDSTVAPEVVAASTLAKDVQLDTTQVKVKFNANQP